MRSGHLPCKELTIDLQNKFLFSSNLFLIQKTLKVPIFSVIDEKLFEFMTSQTGVMTSFHFSMLLSALFRGPKRPPTSFLPLTSTNVGISPENFLTFSFNTFGTLVQNFTFAPSASSKLLNLNQDYPSKKAVFLVKSL